jgi:hypothetical protein
MEMFLKNWDIMRTYRSMSVTSGHNKEIKDKEVTWRTYNGGFSTSNMSSEHLGYWENGYYQGAPYANGSSGCYFIWPGGDIENSPARFSAPGVEQNKISYEDFNLYSPFYGGNAPGSGTIYGQPHIISDAIYNKEKDQWEKTVTREFKNTSGKEITIRELGVFNQSPGAIIARELLENPITVQDDGYFKLSFTWRVENPHENRKEKRIRAYSLPFYDLDTESSQTPHSIIPTEKKRMLLVRMGSIYHGTTLGTIESHKEKFKLTLEGWTHENLAFFYLDERTSLDYNHELSVVSIDLLTPDSSELNKISQPHASSYSSNYRYTSFGWIHLENEIIDVTLVENSLIRQLSNPIIVKKNQNEKNILWLGLTNMLHSSPWSIQTDQSYCDFYYDNSRQNACFFFDQTDATEHSFNIGRDSAYEAIAMVRLNLTLKEGEVLYKDVPVNK